MSIPNKYHVPGVTALWMILLPALFWFFAGAGMDTFMHWLARLLDACFTAFGGSSLFFGFLLLAWTAIEAWRDGFFSREAESA